jgi:hypothetical protein
LAVKNVAGYGCRKSEDGRWENEKMGKWEKEGRRREFSVAVGRL